MEIPSGAPALRRRSAIALVACLVLIWGGNWPVNKTILAHISPLWFACLRMALGAITIFAVQVLRSDRIRLPARGDLPVVLSIGLVQMAAMLALMNLGLVNVAAGRSAILSYTTPLWVVPGAILILGERLSWGKAMALLLGLAGVAFMFNPIGFDWSDRKAVIGNGYLLAAAALWAATTVHLRSHRWRGTPLALVPWQMIVGLLALTVVAWLIEGPPPRVSLSWQFLLLALYSGPVITAFPFWAFVTVARTLPALTTSLTLLLVPVIGLLSSAVFLSEPLTATSVTGLLLIVSAVAAVSLADAKGQAPQLPGR
jgi:drug/metabolite transporter (DMT)-like permease